MRVRRSAAAVLALTVGVSVAFMAQTMRPAANQDLSGTWMPSNWYHQMGGGAPGNLPRNTPTQDKASLLTPWGQERLKAWTPESDPDSRCLSPGAVRSYQSPYPIEFLQTPNRVTILFEYEHLVRRIYMDGRGHPKDFDSAPMGHSIGKWEGDTLVVDTVGLTDSTLLNGMGLPHSEQLHLTERIRRILDGNILEVEFTIDDPKAYKEVWKTKSYWKNDPSVQILEYNCDHVIDYRKLPGGQ